MKTHAVIVVSCMGIVATRGESDRDVALGVGRAAGSARRGTLVDGTVAGSTGMTQRDVHARAGLVRGAEMVEHMMLKLFAMAKATVHTEVNLVHLVQSAVQERARSIRIAYPAVRKHAGSVGVEEAAVGAEAGLGRAATRSLRPATDVVTISRPPAHRARRPAAVFPLRAPGTGGCTRNREKRDLERLHRIRRFLDRNEGALGAINRSRFYSTELSRGHYH